MLAEILAPNTDDGIGTDNMTAIMIYFIDLDKWIELTWVNDVRYDATWLLKSKNIMVCTDFLTSNTIKSNTLIMCFKLGNLKIEMDEMKRKCFCWETCFKHRNNLKQKSNKP